MNTIVSQILRKTARSKAARVIPIMVLIDPYKLDASVWHLELNVPS